MERGQSGKAIPALMLVVNAPRATRTKTHAAPKAEKKASAGLGAVVRVKTDRDAMAIAEGQQKAPCRPRQTL